MARATIVLEDTADGGMSVTLAHAPSREADSKAQNIAADLVKVLQRPPPIFVANDGSEGGEGCGS